MDDTISRQAAIDAIATMDAVGYSPYATIGRLDALLVLRRIPSAERRGRWIFNLDDKGWSWDKPYMCDQCGEWVEKVFKFCPSCGSRMDLDGDTE